MTDITVYETKPTSEFRDLIASHLEGIQKHIERTEGVTASFIKELLRRAWLISQLTDDEFVADKHVQEALAQMLDPLNPLTPKLLGSVNDDWS